MKTIRQTLKQNIYQTVTDRLLASLKAGVIPWEQPWRTPRFAGGPFPRNFRTGKPYRGVNVFLLWASPYPAPFWLTFKQAQELGGTVRKGQKGTPIVFYKPLRSPVTKQSTAATEQDRPPFVFCNYTVFNVEQCDGLTLPQLEPAPTNDVDKDETCEAIVNGWENRPVLHLTSETETRAYYHPSTDSVHMPARSRFVDTPHYYSTLFHELVHSTGHESRLNRPFHARFGEELYSKEELLAEMGAAFLCAIAGIANEHTDRNTTAYLQNWIAKLEMEVDRQYVDSHGQSTVAFAFCRLLGFQLMPRLKATHAQKLYRPEAGQPDAYPNLQLVLTKPIEWELVRQQYDQMIKYTTALRLGTAETEAILRRFTRTNVQHPTYKAFAELGKAIKTIFLCQYLHSEALRREINEGLNVIEQWNGANDFVFFARRGELVSNRSEDHEISMLALHLLQNCMVYINTLMLQRVLAQPKWVNKLTPRDLAALTPLIWDHVNPYGRFDLDMNDRLLLE